MTRWLLGETILKQPNFSGELIVIYHVHYVHYLPTLSKPSSEAEATHIAIFPRDSWWKKSTEKGEKPGAVETQRPKAWCSWVIQQHDFSK